ncbi:MAG: GNAT family N-acetyltransferase [Anaerolineae bacterium]
MLTQTTPYYKELSNGLIMRSVADEADVERLAAFNGDIHGLGVAGMTRELILNHPDTRPEHWLYVEEPGGKEIVSSLCLIPWTLHYEEVSLRAGEMGIVGTREDYRHHGLVRAQAARHAELLQEGGYHLSHIQGIPYFYRQFGYEYALPLEGGWRVELDTVGETVEEESHAVRLASSDDIPVLRRLYEQATAHLTVHSARSEGVWRYLLGPSMRTEMATETWLVLEDQQPIAYLRIPYEGFGEGLIVNEASPLDARAAAAVLRQLKRWSVERHKPYIRLCLPENSPLVAAARYSGGHGLGYYAWQIKLADVPRLLMRIAPVLERRIAESPFAGIDEPVVLNLYCEAFEMRFHKGKLDDVQPLGFSEHGGIRMPPLLLAPLVLGHRSREELAQAYPDVSASGRWQHLVDVLFPKQTSFLYTAY